MADKGKKNGPEDSNDDARSPLDNPTKRKQRMADNGKNNQSEDSNGDDGSDQEEDWSAFIPISGGDNILTGGCYARHDCITEFALHNNGIVLKIASVSALSPLDMINLSWGTNDATGHRIWLGAKLFLHAISQLKNHFEHKRVLEIGAGTGIAGIAVDRSLTVKEIVLTDGSESALNLCRQNCEVNHVSDRVVVEKLSWGDALPSRHGKMDAMKFDTILAADVLYDLEMWPLILKTAKRSLDDAGIIVLSHIPRAAVPLAEAKQGHTIEDILLRQAKETGFEHFSVFAK
ncbi:MAG: hypothetical protein SGARI_004305 [Bacillariaceae sp.]